MEKKQDRQLFHDTLLEFYEKMGNRDFWKSNKAQDIAIEALTQDYLRAGDPKEDSISLQAALSEYHTRLKYMVGSPK